MTGDLPKYRKAKVSVHFIIAVVLLATTALGFETVIRTLKLVTQKSPVPWPAGVTVDVDTFRWENLPTEVGGRYFLVEDGVLSPQKDGKPDGEVILEDDMLDAVGIGTSRDKRLIRTRESSWYLIRVYEDRTVPEGAPYKYWQLAVYYYTGGLEGTVPHVPERCMQAAGATPLGNASVYFNAPKAQAPWDKEVPFVQARFAQRQAGQYEVREIVDYYTFSLNGEPESSWEKVRLKLTSPWEHYTYFAKIQFDPLGGIADLKEADKAAEEFMESFLPLITKALPMPSDVEALNKAQGTNSEKENLDGKDL